MRYVSESIENLVSSEEKMVFLAGPRQVGKTTLARSLLRDPNNYVNWDVESQRVLILKKREQFFRSFSPALEGQKRRLVLDEIHKYPRWKRLLKGLFDVTRKELELIVTGSGRLNLYQRGGDSLFGRYALFRLAPFTVGELLGRSQPTPPPAPDVWLRNVSNGSDAKGAEEALSLIERWTGFPEPLFAQDQRRLVRWRRARRELVFREDLRDLTRIRELGLVEHLAALLPERIGSPLSVNALREDIGASYTTVQGWLSALERLYHHFEIRPYTGKLARALRREAKLYLFDGSLIPEEGPRFENLVALHLNKLVDFWNDVGEGDFSLHYVRDKEKRETDFLILRDKKVWLLLECKLSSGQLDPSLRYFHERLKPQVSIQLVRYATEVRELERKIVLLPAARLLAHS